MQEKIRTIHVYFEEEDMYEEEENPTIEADLVPSSERTRYKLLGICCMIFLCLLCVGIPVWAILLPPSYANTYDTTISKNLTLTISQHPTTNEIQVYAFSTMQKIEQLTVNASGTFHQNATRAEGLITFYNGLFSTQTVPAGTKLTGRDGISVITSQDAVIPAATATTPPTYGTVSVSAYSAISGTMGNIAASDIDSSCCGSSILAQNLYSFSGGQDQRDIPVLTKNDLSNGTQMLTEQVTAAINDQAQKETKPGYLLLPLDCSSALTANHQPGDQSQAAIITLKETCTPLAYFTADIPTVSQHFFSIPHGYHLVSFTVLVLTTHTTATGRTLTVHAIAYLKLDTPTVYPYRFAGK